MASVTSIISEMADVQALLNKSISDTSKEGMIANLKAKIEALPIFDNAAALRLTSAVDAAMMPKTFTTSLMASIDLRLAKGLLVGKGKSSQAMVPQELTYILNFLTAMDWVQLEEPQASPSKMMEVVGQRLSKLGIRSLHEQTVKAAVAVVLWLVRHNTHNWPRYSLIYQWLCEFKRNFQVMKTPWELQMIVKFPMEPRGLPDDIFAHCYIGDDQPIRKELLGFQQLSDHIPLRSNSALLLREQHANGFGGVTSPMQFLHGGHQQYMPGLGGFHASMYTRRPDMVRDVIPDMVYNTPPGGKSRQASSPHQAALVRSDSGASSSHSGSMHMPTPHGMPALDYDMQAMVAQGTPPQAQAPLAYPESTFGPSHPMPRMRIHGTAGMKSEVPEEEQHAISLASDPAEMLEEAAFASLTERALKRPAGSAKVAAKNATADEDDDVPMSKAPKLAMKSPKAKAAPKPAMKRPAKLLCDLEVKFEVSKMATTTRKNYASVWYFRVKSNYIKAGKTPEAAKAEARKAHQFIVDKWDAAEKKAGKA